LIDVGYGFGLPSIFDPITDPLADVFAPILAPLEGLPVIGPLITAITSPEGFWEMVKELIRLPLEQIAKDLVTPGIYAPRGIDTIKTILEGTKDLLGFEQGGILPHTGVFYGHGGERVLSKEDTRAYEGGGVTINTPLIHIGGNLIADKETFNEFAEQIDYIITKRNKRTYA